MAETQTKGRQIGMQKRSGRHKGGKRKNARRRRNRFLPLIIAASAILIIAAAAYAGWNIFIYSGRSRLYKKGGVMNSELLAQLNETKEKAQDVGWEEGWLRYNGKIYKYNDSIITLLILGIDKNSENEEPQHGMDGGQSDANFLAVINPDQKTVRLICIDRNTMTEYQTYDYYGRKDARAKAQLCLAHAYGNSSKQNCENSLEAVKNLFYGLPIHGYCAVNMSAIPEINDAVGGVTLKCMDTFRAGGYSYTKGSQKTLSGMGAYWYVQFRDTKKFKSAENRLQRQKQYLNAFIAQAKTAVKKNPSTALDLYNNITPYMTTNIEADEAAYLAGMALGYDFDTDSVMTLEGETVQGTYYEEFYPDEERLRNLIIDVFYCEAGQTDG